MNSPDKKNISLFITFEGIEGVGKTTQIQLLTHKFKEWGIPVRVTREPGGTMIGNEIRDILLSHQVDGIDATTELLLMFAARAQHIRQIVLPALRAGYVVLCDRFTDATYAYQGAGRGIEASLIRQLEVLVQGDLRPDYTIVLDAAPKLGLERAKKRGHLDRFEREKNAFFERVRQCYLGRAAQHPDRYYVIDAAQTIDQVHQAIVQKLCPELAASERPV